MNKELTCITLSLLAGLACLGQAADASRERIGVYDSRAVAIAYAGSAFQQTKAKALGGELKTARATTNTAEITRLQTEGRTWQTQLHRQGFGTAPVDDLLSHISTQLPKIRQAAGVTTLISKWNAAELNQHRGAEQIDVTMQLVDAFQPTDKQRQHALEIQKTSPQTVTD